MRPVPRVYPLGAAGAAFLPSDAVMRPLKTSESVARDIVHDIVSGGLRTGDRLASEAAMLDQYGVSRESLREGLRLLEVQGLITIRRGPGGGSIVGRVDPANFGRISTLFYHLAGGTYEELFEAWVETEAALAERAARNEDRATVRHAMAPFFEVPESHGSSDTVTEFVLARTPVPRGGGVAGRQPGAAVDVADDRPDRDPPRRGQRRPA